MDKLYDTPVKAIRKKCLDCTCNQPKEIRECTVINCALYPYRMGRRPDESTIESLKSFSDGKLEYSDGFLPGKGSGDDEW